MMHFERDAVELINGWGTWGPRQPVSPLIFAVLTMYIGEGYMVPHWLAYSGRCYTREEPALPKGSTE